jgi:EAL and modified HD-GYP domain-containing signal transduction protein
VDSAISRDSRSAVHVARQPILDHVGRVFGYELLYRATADAVSCSENGDRASARVLCDAVLALGLDTLTAGRPAFLNFTRNLLLSDAGTLLPPAAMVIEVREDVTIDSDIMDACRHLHDVGYALGLDDFVSGSPAEALLPYVKFIKVDVRQTPLASCAVLASRLRPLGVCLVAEKVETATLAAQLRSLGYRLFQGYYFCRPTTFTTAPVPARHLAYIRLLGALSRENLTVTELEDLIKRDVSLSYRVLRSINSPAFGLQREVTSIRQALVLLGRDRICKWASVWTLAGLNAGGSEETLAVALIRARCCEGLGQALGTEEGGSYFLLGLCSLLDAIIGRQMSVALTDMPLPAPVRDALLGAANRAREVLNAVIAYEQGAWDAASSALVRLSIPAEILTDVYADALRWAQELPQPSRPQ